MANLILYNGKLTFILHNKRLRNLIFFLILKNIYYLFYLNIYSSTIILSLAISISSKHSVLNNLLNLLIF